MKAKMDSTEKQDVKSEDNLNMGTMEGIKNDVFRHVQEVSHMVARARFQAREADIRARFASEFAERAVTEAQLAHMVATTLARTGRVVASMALDLANNIPVDTSGDGDFLSFSLPDSSCSMQSGDSTGNSSLEVSFTSPVKGINPIGMHNPRRRSPTKSSPVSSVPKKHDTSYPEDLSPESSLADLLNSSKSLPIVWEDSYSNGWESTPEPWADKKNTLHMLRKLQSRKDNKQRISVFDNDSEDDDEEYFPPVYANSETQTTVSIDKNEKVESSNESNVPDKAEKDKTEKDKNENRARNIFQNGELINDKQEEPLDQEVKEPRENDKQVNESSRLSDDTYKINGFGLDEDIAAYHLL